MVTKYLIISRSSPSWTNVTSVELARCAKPRLYSCNPFLKLLHAGQHVRKTSQPNNSPVSMIARVTSVLFVPCWACLRPTAKTVTLGLVLVVNRGISSVERTRGNGVRKYRGFRPERLERGAGVFYCVLVRAVSAHLLRGCPNPRSVL